MRFACICSGISAPTVAWKPLGWSAAFYAEVETFPSAVLAHHHPTTPNLGDITKFKEWSDADFDVLVGGTPCQSFSVAGLRKGLADPRGNLMLTYLAIADRYRPEWLVWENVPGVLSSGGGRDFGTFLGGLGQLGYGFAYRVLDAQYCGVPQRRRRAFVVGCLGDWRRAAAVLFERHSLQGHPAPRREAGERVAATIVGGTDTGRNHGKRSGSDRDTLIPERERALTASNQRIDAETETLIVGALPAMDTPQGHGFAGFTCNQSVDAGHIITTLAIRGRGDSLDLEYRQDGTANAILTPNGGRGGIGVGAVAFAQNQREEVRMMDVAGALASEPGMKLQTYVALDWQNSAGGPNSEASFQTLCKDRSPAVAVAFDARQSDVIQYGEKTGPLDTDGHTMALQTAMQVRRLTPRECERLQGFPDDFTLIPYRGKPAADGPRYKALGNSMAVPVVRWIGERIDAVQAIRGAA